jgi:hypothetical protein
MFFAAFLTNIVWKNNQQLSEQNHLGWLRTMPINGLDGRERPSSHSTEISTPSNVNSVDHPAS